MTRVRSRRAQKKMGKRTIAKSKSSDAALLRRLWPQKMLDWLEKGNGPQDEKEHEFLMYRRQLTRIKKIKYVMKRFKSGRFSQGKVTYMPNEEEPFVFKVTYFDDDTETMSPWEVNFWALR